MDDLVDGYSQFTALADEASKGLAVDGVRDPLGRPLDATAVTAAAATPASQKHTTASAPTTSSSSRRSQRLPSSGGVFGGGGRDGTLPAPVPAFAAAGPAVTGGMAFGGGHAAGEGALVADPIQDPVARDALKLLFSKEGNYVQVCVLDPLVFVSAFVCCSVVVLVFFFVFFCRCGNS